MLRTAGPYILDREHSKETRLHCRMQMPPVLQGLHSLWLLPWWAGAKFLLLYSQCPLPGKLQWL